MKILVFLCVVVAASAVREPVKKTCREKPETGLCKAYMPSYYYDPETGTCKIFIYGGCGGNGNRYQTEEDCLNNCFGIQVKQESSDVCTLEKVTGPCLAYFRRYYYDQKDGRCNTFSYGGCRGNGNNFKTLQECESTCRPAPQATVDRFDCDKAPDAGLCDAIIPRYYFDKEDGKCKLFVYGGCGGNKNNFMSEEECNDKCGVSMSSSVCEQEKVVGPCMAAFRRFYYNKQSGECEPFIYGGCAGNDNNFQRKEVCEAICVFREQPLLLSARAPTKCHLKPETGLCKGYFERYYYDDESDTCKIFVYGGCGGNDNNFETEGECLDVCSV